MENGMLTVHDKLVLESCTKGMRSKEPEANPFKNALVERLWAIARHRVTKGGVVVDGDDRTPPEWNKCLADIDIVVAAIVKQVKDAVLADMRQGKLNLETKQKPVLKSTKRMKQAIETAWQDKQWISTDEAKSLLGKNLNQLIRLASSRECMFRLLNDKEFEIRKTDTFDEHRELFLAEADAGSTLSMDMWGLYVVDREIARMEDFRKYNERNGGAWQYCGKVNRVNFVKRVKP